MPLETLDETAKRILDAASRRFLHYGFKKTTMSEIADDCNMSTGNLYRYFPSKLDIAETFVRVLRRETIDALRAIISDSELTPAEKIRRCFRHKFRVAYDRFHNNPKAYELSGELIVERPKLAIEWENAEGLIIAEVLKEGEERGDFQVGDPRRMAKIFQDVVFRFTGPAVIHEGEYDDIAEELDAVIELALYGLKCRVAHA